MHGRQQAGHAVHGGHLCPGTPLRPNACRVCHQCNVIHAMRALHMSQPCRSHVQMNSIAGHTCHIHTHADRVCRAHAEHADCSQKCCLAGCACTYMSAAYKDMRDTYMHMQVMLVTHAVATVMTGTSRRRRWKRRVRRSVTRPSGRHCRGWTSEWEES